MASEQLYFEVEGQLYWISTNNDGMGKTTYTYLMDHVPGEVKITSPVPLDTASKKRIVNVQEMNLQRPIITKEPLGTRYDVGSFRATGTIVDAIPENGVDVRQYIASNNTPAEIDRTFGRGTIWEQLSKSSNEDDDSPSKG